MCQKFGLFLIINLLRVQLGSLVHAAEHGPGSHQHNGEYSIRELAEDHLHVYSPDHVYGDHNFDQILEIMRADFVLLSTRVENVVVTANLLA